MDDRAWMSALFRANYELLHRVGSLFLGAGQEAFVEEQIQEVFWMAWTRRGALRGQPSAAGWLVEAMRRRLLALGRSGAKTGGARVLSPEGGAQSAPEREPGDGRCVRPEDFLLGKQRRERLTKLLGREDAGIFWEACIVGERASEMAEKYRISEDAMRMRVSRIKRRLIAHRELFFAAAVCLILL